MTGVGALVTVIQESVREVTGNTPALSTGAGTSDGRFLASIATEIVEFGPLNDTIHQIDERVAVDDLAQLSVIYEKVARRLLGG